MISPPILKVLDIEVTAADAAHKVDAIDTIDDVHYSLVQAADLLG